MSQGLWGYTEGTIDEPLYPTPVDKDGKPEKVSDEEKAKYQELHAPWKRSQDMAQGSIMLRLTPSIQQNLSYITTAESLWDALRDAYDVTNVPTVYKDFKEIFSFRINPNQHPAPQFDRLSAALGRLKSTNIKGRTDVLTLHETLQGLIALAALPHKWEHLVPIVITTNDIDEVTLAEVRSSVIAQYETETNKGQHKSASSHAAANKLSTVKRKRGNPRFAQQDRSQSQAGPSNPNQQQHRQHSSRGSGRGGKDKGKGKKRDGHSHVTSVAFAAPVFTTDAALPPPSSSTIAHFGASSSMVTQTVHQSPPALRTKGIYPSVNKAISLLERMEVKPTIQTTKKLEQRFLKLDNEVRTRAGFYEDDYSSDEDMSRTVPGPLREIFAATPSDLADLSENRAPTPPYISPQSVVTDLGHSDPEAE